MKTWKTIAELTGIDWNDGALSVLRTGTGTSIVRPTTTGEFAVLALSGAKAKIVKVLPTLERARAYNFAIAR